MKDNEKAASKSTPSKTVIISRKKVRENSQNPQNFQNPVQSPDTLPELRPVRRKIPPETAKADPKINAEPKNNARNNSHKKLGRKLNLKKLIWIFLALCLFASVLILVVMAGLR
ncbi:MAG: hypothetical protein K2J71_01130, partial [Oscillospiraceae bacterium]|nr:hypothetical protein [Oscillospiraceae bacterium]